MFDVIDTERTAEDVEFTVHDGADNKNYEQQDFQETQYAGSNTGPAYDPIEVLWKRKKKADIASAAITVGMNSIPLLYNVIKHRKDPNPSRVDRNAVTRLMVNSAFPVVQMVDTVAFKGKLQKFVDDKVGNSLGLGFNDIRNIFNLITMYPLAHHCITTVLSNVAARSQDPKAMQTPIDGSVKANLLLQTATLITPYVTDKFTDDSKSLYSKINSVLPISVIGYHVRKFVRNSRDPRVQNVYNFASAGLKVANYGTNQLSQATRNNGTGGTVNRVGSEINSVIDTVQKLIGDTGPAAIGDRAYYGDDYYGRRSGRAYDAWSGAIY